MTSPVAPRLRLEDLLYIVQAVALQPASNHGGRTLASIFVRLGEAEVDEPVGLVVRVEYHVQEAALSPVPDLRRARDGLRLENPVAHDPQPPGLLRDQHLAPGEEGDGPGVLQTIHDGHDSVGSTLGFIDRRLGRSRGRGPEAEHDANGWDE